MINSLESDLNIMCNVEILPEVRTHELDNCKLVDENLTHCQFLSLPLTSPERLYV